MAVQACLVTREEGMSDEMAFAAASAAPETLTPEEETPNDVPSVASTGAVEEVMLQEAVTDPVAESNDREDEESSQPSPPISVGSATASAPAPNQGVAGLALSHVQEFAGMSGEPDDDDVEPVPIGASPLVSLGHSHDAGDFKLKEAKVSHSHDSGDFKNKEAKVDAPAMSDQGDVDPSSRARDLISRDLLDELTHEPDDWNEGRNPPTPPITGFETPSEPGTPSPREAPQPQYFHSNSHTSHTSHTTHSNSNQKHDGLMCIDQWDWKTDAPEFVPGSMKGLLGHTDVQVVGAAYQQQGAWTMQSQQQQGAYQPQQQSTTATSGSVARTTAENSGSGDNVRLTQLRANYEWQLRTKSDELRDMQQRMNQLEIETAQVRASWEIERRNLVRQIGHYRAVLERYCIPVEEAGSGYNMEDPQSQYFPVFEPSAPSQWPSANASAQGGVASSGTATSSTAGFGTASSQAAYAAGSSQQAQAGFAPVSSDSHFVGQQQGLYGATPAATTSSASAPADSGGKPVSSSLDSKMQRLNNLLQEGNASANRNRNSNGGQGDGDGRDTGGDGGGYTGSSIASTLRAMFPHATIRTKSAPGAEGEDAEGEEVMDAVLQMVDDLDATGGHIDERTLRSMQALKQKERFEVMDAVLQMVDDLEGATGGHFDDRAMRSMQALPQKDRIEALTKVEEVVEQQGGQCRNLSSILQSVCRKLEKRRDGRKHHGNDEDGFGARQPNGGREHANDGGSRYRDGGRRARRVDEDVDAFDSSESSGEVVPKASVHTSTWPQEFERAALRAAAKAAREEDAAVRSAAKEVNKEPPVADIVGTPASKRSAAGSKSWADLEDGDDDDREGDEFHTADREEDSNPWTAELIDKHARKGFELRRRGDHWDLKIVMNQLDPPLTETGMERYCRWLRVRLTSFREEHGAESLWRCRGEVDFSHNHMTNQMVWMLLETLAQHEVHTALLKLYANHISQGGVLAICEFIRMNERAEAVHELHLSHNEIDDESALELLRTLKSQRQRYPPRRTAEGSGEMVLAPVWLRLNHNRIRDPAAVLRAAEDEKISICTAWDRQVCGTSKCVRQECPLVHLYAFTVQDLPKYEKPDENGDAGRRRDRRREHDRRRRDRKDGKKDEAAETGAWAGEASWDERGDRGNDRLHARDAWDGS